MPDEDEIEDHPELPERPHPYHPGGFEHFVRENPTAAVVGALVIGILLGRMGVL